ncbi:MAG: ABC transporter ATP-binding protein [Gammaproteobacteria bacterium]|nr:ABC transporter ATP-binding protein [Gammaproteobacteria bacterium]
MSDTLLSVQGINTYYGNSHILQGVSINAAQGKAVAILGRNGAGKTTTLHSIMGLVKPRSGSIFFANYETTSLPAYEIARLGIGFVPETRGIFPSLSVLEHLTLAKPHNGNARNWTLERIFTMFPRLSERLSHRGAQLSGGEQQMLSIARALLTEPKLLVLDEPTEGLAPTIVTEISSILTDLKRSGTSILLVEQNYRFATALADEVYVLGKGRIRWHGASSELEQQPDIKHTWLGV